MFKSAIVNESANQAMVVSETSEHTVPGTFTLQLQKINSPHLLTDIYINSSFM